MNPSALVRVFALSVLPVVLTGCAADLAGTAFTATAPAAIPGASLNGRVHGGQQPVSNAKVYLYAAGTGGLGTASRSMLNGAGYVTTGRDGSFSITGDYTCQPGDLVYLLALGGNPGLASGTNNSWIALEAALGPCAALTPSTFISVNEVTTVAAAYALHAFQSAPGMLASGSSDQAKLGLANAFAMVNLLVNNSTGIATPENLAAQTVIPGPKINSLANVIASCVNSDGTGSGCSGFEFAVFSGVNRSFISNVLQGLINLARQPDYNPITIFNLSTANAPFQPALTSAPNDWTLVVAFGNGKLYSYSLAIDGFGNAWMTMPNNDPSSPNKSTIGEVSPTGVLLSPPGGYTAGGLQLATQGLGIDASNNVWVADEGNPSATTLNPTVIPGKVVKLDNSGNLLSPAAGFADPGSTAFNDIAIDGLGGVWTDGSNGLTKFDNNGVLLSGTNAYSSGSTYNFAVDAGNNLWAFGQSSSSVNEYNAAGTRIGVYPQTDSFYSVGAIDNAGGVWLLSSSSVGKMNSSGTVVSPAGGYTGGGLRNPDAIAIDGAGMAWVANYYYSVPDRGYPARVSVLTSSGSPYSFSNGYQSNYFSVPLTIAIDPSGNVWVGDQYNAVTVMVGAATPVVTPIAAGIKNGTLASVP